MLKTKITPAKRLERKLRRQRNLESQRTMKAHSQQLLNERRARLAALRGERAVRRLKIQMRQLRPQIVDQQPSSTLVGRLSQAIKGLARGSRARGRAG